MPAYPSEHAKVSLDKTLNPKLPLTTIDSRIDGLWEEIRKQMLMLFHKSNMFRLMLTVPLNKPIGGQLLFENYRQQRLQLEG